MPDLLTRSQRAPVVGVDGPARTVTVRLCRWNHPREVADRIPGQPTRRYREAYRPGSIEVADNCHVVDHHHGDLIGRADPSTVRDDGAGPTVDLVLARTAAANDTLALIEAGVIQSVSMEIEPTDGDAEVDGIVWRSGIVHGIAFAFRPAHDAPILALRSTDPSDNGDPDMPDTTTPETLTRAEVDAMLADQAAGLLSREAFDAALDDVRRDMLADRNRSDVGAHPLARFRSLVDFADAMYSPSADLDPATLHRALTDQITTQNPGVIPPAWVQSVAGIITQARAVITSFGAQPLPDSGMEVNWPYFDGDLTTLVAEQTAEKSPIVSVRVDLDKGSADIVTYAGGSDISYQLIRRSSPSYRDAYLRIMMQAYAIVTEIAAGAAAVAASTATAATWDPATDDLAALGSALFQASVDVESATGAPASFVLAGSSAFVAIGGLTAPTAAGYGVQNVPGTGSARTLSVSVNDLPVRHAKGLGPADVLVSNDLAGAWHEDGPMTVAAEDVEKLGQNVAVWGMGVFVPYLPNGIVKLDAN